jgi:hypothetical protein
LKRFLEVGKKRLSGDTAREASADEIKDLRAEARQLKETLAEHLLNLALGALSIAYLYRKFHNFNDGVAYPAHFCSLRPRNFAR